MHGFSSNIMLIQNKMTYINTYKILPALLLGMMITVATSCSKDKDTQEPATLEGIWKIEKEIRLVASDDPEQEQAEEEIKYPNGENNAYIEFNGNVWKYAVKNYAGIVDEHSGLYATTNGRNIDLTYQTETYPATYTITGNKITIDFESGPFKQIVATKEAPAEEPGNNDDDDGDGDGDDDNTATGCAARHKINQQLGLDINPMLVETGVTVKEKLIQTTTGNMFRFYLQVEKNKTYRIRINEIVAPADVNKNVFNKYATITISENFIAEGGVDVSEKNFPTPNNPLTYMVVSDSECLYIQVHSYLKDVEVTITVDQL